MLRVMLVDDEENALDVLEIMLGEIGNVTVTGRFTNAIQAIGELESAMADAVFLDIQMPGMRGLEAARAILERQPRMLIVFTTAYSDYAVEAFEIASADYLLKPIAKERLHRTVERLQQRSAERPSREPRDCGAIVQCMGGFQIQLSHGEHEHLQWKTNKEKELCAFLIHHGGEWTGSELIIEALWPESDREKAKAYLYTCMSYLRRTLQHYGLQASLDRTGRGYRLLLNGVKVDTEEFTEAVQEMMDAGRADEGLYNRLNARFPGEYMERCDYGWAMARREELTAKYIRALRSACRLFQTQGSPALAADSLRRVLALSPTAEKDARELMKLYMDMGERPEAIKIYRKLEHEVCVCLGAQLEAETESLYSLLVLA